MPITASDAVAHANELIPELHERAAQTALDRRHPQSQHRCAATSRAMKTMQASRNGGYALGDPQPSRRDERARSGCGSTAWVAGVVQAHSWLMSHFPEQGQDDVYGGNGDAVVSAVIGPRGKAVRTPDGYRAQGVWPFGSGCERADWLLLGGVVFDEDGNEIDQGDFMVPQSDGDDQGRLVRQRAVRHRLVHDGAEPVDVPAHRFLSLPGLIMGNSPAPGCTATTGCIAARPVPVLTIALLRRCDRDRQAGARRLPGGDQGQGHRLHRRPTRAASVHSHPPRRRRGANPRRRVLPVCGRRRARRHGARQRRGPVPAPRRDAQRLRDCRSSTAGGCRDPVSRVGRQRVRTASPINRALADIQTINNHGLMKLETNQEMYGRLLLGLDRTLR